MAEEKKDVFTLACEHIFELHMYKACQNCPAFKTCCIEQQRKHIPKNCIKNIKKYFQEQADIPNGWDVVLDIYEIVNGRIDTLLTIKSLNTYMVPKKMLKEIIEIQNFIKIKLKEAGIEVDDG